MAAIVLRFTGKELIPVMEIPLSATINELKERIEALLDVHVTRQTLSFNRETLRDDKTVGYYFSNLLPHATVALAVQTLQGEPDFNISVKFEEDMIDVRVKETTLVYDLKGMIERRSGILSKHMKLLRLGTEMVDHFPISSYYVCGEGEGSQVELTLNINPR
ncbi:Ubiquitin domain-containing protein [Melia azedarach]|uniref:Ubiquitin domain-containing protein n=1 Tax=Melia azedarach TaxID=155640 RepID=A0ACC1YLN1_MELAZ|nr:Ubiquitin domain-containing protein [Melia azedarach]